MRVLCVYAAYEKNAEYRENIRRFLHGGGLLPGVDTVVVVNGETSVPLPPESATTRVLRRPNVGYDFGAWGDALRLVLDAAPAPPPYDAFVFVNGSVRGPYTQRHGPDWVSALTRLLTPEVRLVGLTINVCTLWRALPPDSHVQSMLFAADAECLRLLRARGIFDPVPPEAGLMEVVRSREVLMSQLVLQAGWNLSCMASRYQGLDYRTLQHNPNAQSARYQGDPFFPGAYFGGTLDWRELMFVKTERLPDAVAEAEAAAAEAAEA